MLVFPLARMLVESKLSEYTYDKSDACLLASAGWTTFYPNAICIPDNPGMIEKVNSLFESSHAGTFSTYDNTGTTALSEYNLITAEELMKDISLGVDIGALTKDTSVKKTPFWDKFVPTEPDFITTQTAMPCPFKKGDILSYNLESNGEPPDLDGYSYSDCKFYRVHKIESNKIFGMWYTSFEDAAFQVGSTHILWYISSHNWNKLFVYYSSPSHSMSALSKLRDALRGQPEKKFRQSGLQGTDGEFTLDARAIFLEHLMTEDAKKEDGVLQKAADAINKAKEDEKCTKGSCC